ncbi:MAG: type IV pilus assembly protein PilM [Planctomycetota bacterium]
MFRKVKSIVGIDLGSQAVKAIEVTLDGTEPVITGYASALIEADGDRSNALAKVLESGAFKSKQVVTSVSGQSVVVRYITMVRMSESELKQAIQFESDKYLPFDADEVVLDCQALERVPTLNGDSAGAAEDQMSVVLAACKTASIEEQVGEVRKLGLNPVAVDVDVFALANAFEVSGQGNLVMDEENSETTAIALVDIGASCTSINVVVNGETCFSREIGIGGGDMTQACSRRLGLEVAEAEEIKCNPEGRESEISRAIGPVLEDLVSEISLSIDYVENREGLHVEEVLLSGGGVLAPGVVNFIEQATGRSARTWNPLEGIRVDASRVDIDELEKNATSLAVAVGLASRVIAA